MNKSIKLTDQYQKRDMRVKSSKKIMILLTCIKDNRFQSSITPCIDHLPDTNYWHYSLQLNTYKYMLEKNYGEKVVGMYLVCLHPNNANKSYIRLKVPHLKQELKDLMKLRKSMVEKIEDNEDTIEIAHN